MVSFRSNNARFATCPASAVLASALLVVLLLSGLARAEDVVLDGIVATVNGKIITRYDLDEQMRPVYEQIRGHNLSPQELSQVQALRQQALERMIDDMLILEDSERYKLKITDLEIQDQIKEFREKRNLSEEDFKKQLDLQHMTMADFTRNMRRDMIKHRLIGGVVNAKVVVTESEIQEEYNNRKAELSKDSMVQLALILLPAQMSATELKANIEAGKLTFAEAAEKYSQGPGASQGGDIGFIAWKDLAPEWNEKLRGLKVGQIADPVHVNDFEGLLEVVSLKEGEELPLDAVHEQISSALHEAKFEKTFKEYLAKLREKAVIEYRNL